MPDQLSLRVSPPRGSQWVRPPRRPDLPGVPWRTWQVLIVLALFAAIQVAASYFLGLVFPEMGWPSPSSPGMLLAEVVAISHAAGWLMAWLLVVRWHRRRFGAALAFKRQPAARLALAFGAAILVYGVVMLPALVWPPPPDRTNMFLEIFKAGGLNLLLLLVIAVVLAPLMEELLFRGLLLPALRRRLAFPAAALLTTLLFTALHFTQTGTYWPAVAGIFVCGAFLAWLRERTGSLWTPIAFHMGFNTTPFLVWLANLDLSGIQ
jgi:membrane protease YdiL (CAAX protease family)